MQPDRPNFTITLLHTPHKHPTFASFLVPLWFSKLDLKDYLYNLYNIQVLRVRSQVIQSPVREGKPSDRIAMPHRFFRPQSTKRMTVELVTGVAGQGPFVWPAEPENWAPWAKEQFEEAKKQQEASDERRKEGGKAWPLDMDTVAEKARLLAKAAGVKVKENPERLAPGSSVRDTMAVRSSQEAGGRAASEEEAKNKEELSPAVQEPKETLDKPLSSAGGKKEQKRSNGQEKAKLQVGRAVAQRKVSETMDKRLIKARNAIMREWYGQHTELFKSDRPQYEAQKASFVEMMEGQRWRVSEPRDKSLIKARNATMREWYDQHNALFKSDRSQYEVQKARFVEMMEERGWK